MGTKPDQINVHDLKNSALDERAKCVEGGASQGGRKVRAVGGSGFHRSNGPIE
jgi:hypothetical protein